MRYRNLGSTKIYVGQAILPPKDFISILEQVYFPWNDFRVYGTTLFFQRGHDWGGGSK